MQRSKYSRKHFKGLQKAEIAKKETRQGVYSSLIQKKEGKEESQLNSR